MAIILPLQSSDKTPKQAVVFFPLSQEGRKRTSYCARALLSPKVGRCLLSKAALKTKFKQAFPKLFLRKHLKPTTTSLCATHKTWLSYSEISNYCNEILSERVKQYFLQFTHLDFLVNKLKGRWSTPTIGSAQARAAIGRQGCTARRESAASRSASGT